ncbi:MULTISPECIES: TfoX/Sxy family protein [Microbacterium]|nr:MULTISPECIES: TfoX/Sxy family protein [Microbacterium]
MTTPAPRSQQALAERIRVLLTAYPDVREVRMFGGLSFMVNERMAVAAGRVGDLLVRVNPADYDALLEDGGVPAFMGKDRPMGPGWLSVPSERVQDESDLAHWLDVGIHSGDAKA